MLTMELATFAKNPQSDLKSRNEILKNEINVMNLFNINFQQKDETIENLRHQIKDL